MSGVADLAAEIRDTLTDNGLVAVTDPRRISPPCVLILPEEATFGQMQPGVGATTWVLRVLAPPPGNSDAFAVLADLTARTIRTIPDLQEARVGSYASDGGDVAWPCVELRFTAVASWT